MVYLKLRLPEIKGGCAWQKGSVVILADFNARVGRSSDVDIGLFGEETSNASGILSLISFLNEVELVICNVEGYCLSQSGLGLG